MKVSIEDIGKQMEGRVCDYSKKKGYGFIYTEDKKTIFVSSFALGRIENQIVIGMSLRFTVGEYKNKPIATDIEVIEKYKDNEKFFSLPDGNKIPIRNLRRVGKDNDYEILKNKGYSKEELKSHGYKVKDLNCVYIDTNEYHYKFYGESSPIEGDGKINLKDYVSYMEDTLLNRY